MGGFPIGSESFETANCHRLEALGQSAFAFALLFLRAHTSTDGRQRVRLFDDIDRSTEISLSRQFQEGRNVDVYRASFNAERAPALNSALCFGDRLLRRIAVRHFIIILDAF